MTSGLELPAPADPVDHGGVLPHFSPDGTSLLFEGNGPTQNLFYGPVDGSRAARAIGPTYSYLDRQGFYFSPDGTKIVLVETGKVSLIDVATGETTVLTDIPTGPSWQRLAP
jgi:Tol biopolymer transport system component